MAQSGYTPILIYASGTASNVPSASNMTSSASGAELALNYADGKLYYKNSSGVVTLLASATTVTNSFSAGTTGLTPNTATTGAVTLAGTLITSNGGTGLSSYTAGDLSYYASGTALTKLAIGTNGYILQSTGSAPSWVAASTVVGGAAGSNTQVQFNNSGALGASSGLTWNGSTLAVTGALSATGDVTVSNGKYYVVNTYGYYFGGASNLTGFTGSNGTGTITVNAYGSSVASFTQSGLAVTGTTTSSSRFIVSGSSNAGTTDISYGSYSGGNWINSPSGYTGYLAIAGTGVASWNAAGLTVDAGTLTVTGTGSRGVRLRGVGAGEVAIAGDGTTYVLSNAFYNTTSYATQLGGMFAYAAGGTLQYLSIGISYNSSNSLFILPSGNVGVGFGAPATKLDVNGTIRLTPNTADTNYTASIYGTYNSSHPFQIDVKNNGSTFEMLGVYADSGGSNNRACFPSFPVVIGTTAQTTVGEKFLVSGYTGTVTDSVAAGIYSGASGTKDLNFYSNGNSQFFTAARIRVTADQYTDAGIMAFWTTSNNGANVLTFSEKARITSTGTFVVNPNGGGSGNKLYVYGGGSGALGALVLGDGSLSGGSTNYWNIGRDNTTSGAFTFAVNGSEVSRFTNGGDFCIGALTSGSSTLRVLRSNAGAALYASQEVATNNTTAVIYQTVAGGNGSQNIGLVVAIQAQNNADRIITAQYWNSGSPQDRFYVQRDGSTYNSNGVYGTISDRTLKQDIVDATSQWDDFKNIKFRKYRMIADVQADPNAPHLLGVVAQELEESNMHGLVETPTQIDGTKLTKQVKLSVLQMKGMKALQEAMERIEQLEARLAAANL
jgi:hypothetical protein